MRWEVNIYGFELLACLGRINSVNVDMRWFTWSIKISIFLTGTNKAGWNLTQQKFECVIMDAIHVWAHFILALATTFSTT